MNKSQKRWNDMVKEMKKAQIKNYQRISAIDGKKLKWSQIKEKTNFLSRNFFTTKPILGGSLSHLKAWKTFVKNSQPGDWTIIFEDDAQPIPNFLHELKKLQKEVERLNQKGHQIEIVKLACTGGCCPEESDFVSLYISAQARIAGRKRENISQQICKPSLSLSGAGYLLSYQGALKLINGFEKGIFSAVDIQWNIYLNQYASRKRLVELNSNCYNSTI